MSKIFTSLLLYPIIIIILTLVLVVNQIVRQILSILLWLEYEGNVFIVSGADAIWDCRTPGNTRMVLVCLVTSRGQLDTIDNCVKTWEDRLFQDPNQAYQKLQCIITKRYGYTCWKIDQSFLIARHIRTLDKNFEHTENDVSKVLTELTEDMDDQKPQWEWVLLPKYIDSNGEKKSLQILRFHHTYMDGMSGLMLISKISDNFKFILDPLTFNIPLWKKTYFYMNCILYGPATLFEMHQNKSQNYWNPRQARSGSKFLAWTNDAIDLNILKQIKFRTKASISTIVSVAFAEACKTVLPKERLVIEMTISELVAFLPYPNPNPQNRFGGFSYAISLQGNEENILQRLENTRQNSLAGISGPEPLLVYYLARLVGHLSYHLQPFLFNGANSSVHLSNIPCAKESFRYFNAEVEEFIAFPPLPNATGLCVASLSYNGGLKICCQADSSWLAENELREILQKIPKVIEWIARCTITNPNDAILRNQESVSLPQGGHPNSKSSTERSDFNDNRTAQGRKNK